MVTKDLQEYAEGNWEKFWSTISIASMNKKTGIPLVEHSGMLYNFDDISKLAYSGEDIVHSADGLIFHPGVIELIEFKSGFKRKLTKQNVYQNKEIFYCKDGDKFCEDYWKVFFDKAKKEIKELMISIRMKAIDSYITLEKHIFPLCPESSVSKKIMFTAVIDADEVDNMEDILLELSHETNNTTNTISRIRDSLHKLTQRKDASGNDYYYDCIEVLSVTDFLIRLRDDM